MERPEVSVVIPCHNAAGWVGEAVRSALDQAGVRREVIVVDDGSTDGTAEKIEEIFGERGHLIRSGHAGVSRARTLGTERAMGDFLQYLDSDDLLAPGKFYRQVEALREKGGEVAYGGWQEFVREEDGRHRMGAVRDEGIGERSETALLTRFWSPPAAYLFARRIVEKVGGWHPELPVIQDARFAWECARRGGRFVRTPGVTAFYHRNAGGSLSTRDRRAFLSDCLRNAVEVQGIWEQEGGVSPERRRALLEAFAHVARGSFDPFPDLFEAAWRRLEALSPNWRPDVPPALALLSRCIGYRRAERVASIVRRLKGEEGRS